MALRQLAASKAAGLRSKGQAGGSQALRALALGFPAAAGACLLASGPPAAERGSLRGQAEEKQRGLPGEGLPRPPEEASGGRKGEPRSQIGRAHV